MCVCVCVGKCSHNKSVDLIILYCVCLFVEESILCSMYLLSHIAERLNEFYDAFESTAYTHKFIVAYSKTHNYRK